MGVKSLTTIDDLIRAAVNEPHDEVFVKGFGFLMSPGVDSLVKLSAEAGCDLFWVFLDASVHTRFTSAGACSPADIEAFPHLPKLNKVWDAYGDQYAFCATWTLRKLGECGAQLCIHEGLTESGEDRSLELVPVQDYFNCNVPWGDAERFSFYMTRNVRGWLFLLRSEY